jgi:hypothetical protein
MSKIRREGEGERGREGEKKYAVERDPCGAQNLGI